MHRSVPRSASRAGSRPRPRRPPIGSRPRAAARRWTRRRAAAPRSWSRPGRSPAARQAMRNGALSAEIRRPRRPPRGATASPGPARPGCRRTGRASSRRGQPRHEVVPHHPAGRREPAEAVGRPQVRVERECLEVLEEDPAVAVDDRLGQPGRPRREQHVQRVVERDRLDGERRRLGEQRRPRRPRRGPRQRPPPRNGDTGSTTVARTVGSDARTSATSADRSTTLSP